MNRFTVVRTHAVAGVAAFVLISCFFISSLVAELSGVMDWIISVKKAVYCSMWAMLFIMPIVVKTGFKLAGSSMHPIIKRKRTRLKWIAMNGFILMVLAFSLYRMAIDGRWDRTFMATQVIELGLGATNIVLLGSMIRDGLKLRSKSQKHTRPAATHKKSGFIEWMAFLLTFLFSIGCGIVLWEFVPQWQQMDAHVFLDWFSANGVRIGLVMLPLQMLSLMFCCWSAFRQFSHHSPAATLWAIASLLIGITFLMFFLYFKEANASLMSQQTSLSGVARELKNWQNWHTVRTIIALASTICTALALFKQS